LPEDFDISGCPLLLHSKNREYSGLASAIRSKQAEHLVPANPESVASDGRRDPNCIVLLVKIIDFQYQRGFWLICICPGLSDTSFLLEYILIGGQSETDLSIPLDAIKSSEYDLLDVIDQQSHQKE
jgi:hypothetical protein